MTDIGQTNLGSKGLTRSLLEICSSVDVFLISN